jgi:hypothetical protein
VCLFDFTYKSVLPAYFIFRAKPESYQVREEHFYPRESLNQVDFAFDELNQPEEEKASPPDRDRQGIVVE